MSKVKETINVLYEAEAARKEGCRKVCALLPPNRTLTVALSLLEHDNKLGLQYLIKLLEEVSHIVEHHSVRWNITDWPYKNFWGNPYEPKHSKLLGYFLDPKHKHECDAFLRGKLLEVLENTLNQSACPPPVAHQFPSHGCQVDAESRYIDLCIQHRDKPKYAIIIENKINGAINRDEHVPVQRECHFVGRRLSY